jgi:sigma-54 dependent transcriptional regulator, acetoin dehydrogenase operon transcriptional activator AcoR
MFGPSGGGALLAEGPEAAAHRGRLAAGEWVAGEDAGVARSLELARRSANRGIPMLIGGESGCGKEMFARAVHALSNRYAGRFVAFSCAALPESHGEHELFGRAPAADPGAAADGYRGRAVLADGGVLFLDDLGDLPPALQARLLRLLDTGEVVPAGAARGCPVDVLVIGATHGDLEQRVEQGAFRADLYYRMGGLRLDLPALRARTDRRRLLAAVLQEESAGQAVFLPAALAALDRYAWPGNLREMRSVIAVALALVGDGLVLPEHLPEAVRSPAVPPADERAQLLAGIQRQGGNLSALARQMGISRSTLYRRLRQLSVAIPLAGGDGG